MDHAKFSASGSYRWMQCPASIRMEEGYPDETSEYAIEGTKAHDMAEKALIHKVAATELLETHPEFNGEEDMAHYVQEYLDYVRNLPGELMVEQRVSFDHIVPEGFGTSDAIVYDMANSHLYVVDLKYGQGVRVDAENNPQLQLYALGSVKDFSWMGDIDRVTVAVVQPRLDHISEWEVSVDDLNAFGERATAAAAEALSDAPTFGPGSACTFCKAKADCRALHDHVIATAAEDFEEGLVLRDTDKLTIKEVARILPHFKTIQSWMKAVEARALHTLGAGGDVPGYKLVAGRSIRRWIDDAQAENALVNSLGPDGAFEKKLISPAVAEKKLGKKDPLLTELVEKPAGKPTLAPESDKRQALPTSAERDFAETVND